MSVSFIGGDNRPLSVPYGGRNYARGETLIVTLDRYDLIKPADLPSSPLI